MKSIKFGIVGFGIFGEKRLIPGFQGAKFAELKAIHKRNMEQVRLKVKEYNIERGFNKIDDLLKDPEIDAVFIATPNKFHRENALAAAKAGKHILLEKPMAMNTQECEEIIQTCKAHNVKLMIAQCLRYNTSINYIKNLIDNGELGEISYIAMNFSYDANFSKRKWIYSRDIAGGGPLVDLGVHLIDTIRYLTGKEIDKVNSLAYIESDKSVETSVISNFVIGKIGKKSDVNPILGSMHCSFRGNYLTYIQIVGSKGTLYAENFNRINSEVELHMRSGLDKKVIKVRNGDCYSAEIDAFSKCILENGPSPIDGNEGLKNQMILDQISAQIYK